MIRYRLRSLLILLAILPPLLWFGWTKYETWRAERERQNQRAVLRLWLATTGQQAPPNVLRATPGKPKEPLE